MALKVAPEQQGFVAPVSRSLAQAAYQPLGRPLGLYARGEPVGMLLLYDARWDHVKPASQLYVWRLMVDVGHQRQGHGRAAMLWVIAEARRMGVAEVGLSHVEANGTAGAFYESLGFRYTGKVEDGEREMLLRLEPATSDPTL
ncbi:MAG: GNAT family N-acetyltransferase [Aquabacterium sp.]